MEGTLSVTENNSEQSLPPQTNENGEVITKENATPEQKKEYALNKKAEKNLARNAANQAKIAELEEKSKAQQAREAELQEKLEAATAPKAPSSDLELDDPEEFSRQQSAHNEYLNSQHRKQLKAELRADIQKETQAEAQAEVARQAEAELIGKVESFVVKGEAVGLSEDALEGAAIALNDAGITSDIQAFLLDDESGPQIVDFLASSSKDLAMMAKLSPLAQVKFIENTVRSKALLNKPNVSGAPEPLLNIGGGGAKEQDEFESLCPGAVFK
jgi:DNA-nicking Smr family endonuclease